MAETKQRRDYGSGSISQRADGTWTARMVIGVNEKGKPRMGIYSLHIALSRNLSYN